MLERFDRFYIKSVLKIPGEFTGEEDTNTMVGKRSLKLRTNLQARSEERNGEK